jgi:hypothetical protein
MKTFIILTTIMAFPTEDVMMTGHRLSTHSWPSFAACNEALKLSTPQGKIILRHLYSGSEHDQLRGIFSVSTDGRKIIYRTWCDESEHGASIPNYEYNITTKKIIRVTPDNVLTRAYVQSIIEMSNPMIDNMPNPLKPKVGPE